MDNFYFILKTPQSASLSHGNYDETYNIRCHAQSQRRARSRSPMAKVVPKDRRPSQWPSYQSGLRSRSTSSLMESDAAASESTPGSATTNSVWYLAFQHVATSEDGWNPLAFPANSRGDPFNSTLMPSDPITNQIFRFMMSDFHKTNFTAEALVKSSGSNSTAFRHEAAFAERIKSCFHDPVVLNTSLAYAAAAMGWRFGIRFQRQPPEFYIHRAYVAVRNRLDASSEVDDVLIMSIYSLGMSEAWTQNHDAAAAHIRGAIQLAGQLGGLVHLSSYVMESMILGAKFLALFSNKPSVMCLDWEPPAWSQPHVTFDTAATRRDGVTSGQSFFVTGNGMMIDDKIEGIIRTMISLVKVHNWGSAQENPIPGLERWLYLKTQAVSHRLLCHQTESPRQKTLRIALMLWILMITEYIGAQATAYMYLQQLQDVEAEDFETEDAAAGLILWISCVGAMIALPAAKLRCPSQGTCECQSHGQADFFVSRVAALASRLNLAQHVGEYRRFLEGYFYMEDRQGERLTQLVEAVGALEMS